MQSIFEELDFQHTPFGDISLRRRSEPRLDHKIIFEVKLGDEFLMSSLFVEAEQQLAALGLAELRENGFVRDLNVVVGGLGLGYTALQALQDDAVSCLRVIDVMQAVISWHRQGILPVGDVLAKDPRCELVHDDFFAVAMADTGGFISAAPVHAVLLDIDHSPSHWLSEGNRSFYTAEALDKMASKIVAGGIFGLWSNDLPEQTFIELLECVFSSVKVEIVSFDNPYSGGLSTNSVYLATV